MAMSKKDFIALADYIRDHNQIAEEIGNGREKFTADQLQTLGNFCQSTNSAFLRRRWEAYIAGECGPNGGAR